MRKSLLFISIIMCCFSCHQEPKSVAQLDWMIGTWTREFNGHLQMEEWQLRNDTLIGSNSFINLTDTTLMVSQKIFVSNQSFVLETQENGFEFHNHYIGKSMEGKLLQFENQNTSWPQSITYTNKANQQLEVLASGFSGTMAKDFNITYIQIK